MKTHHTSLASLILCAALTGCVTQRVDASGNPIVESENGFKDAGKPAVTENDLVIVSIYKIESPTVVYVNKNNPIKVVFAGVAGPDKATQPNLYDDALSVLWSHQRQSPIMYLRRRPGTDLEAKTMYGTLLRTMDSGAFAELTEGMLSLGLLRIRDEAEFSSKDVVARMRARQAEAQAKGLGIWGVQR